MGLCALDASTGRFYVGDIPVDENYSEVSISIHISISSLFPIISHLFHSWKTAHSLFTIFFSTQFETLLLQVQPREILTGPSNLSKYEMREGDGRDERKRERREGEREKREGEREEKEDMCECIHQSNQESFEGVVRHSGISSAE